MSPVNLGSLLPRATKQYHDKPYEAISPLRRELNLDGKTVLITGGATGIGLETTKAFAQAGASLIVLLARSQKPMDEVKQMIEAQYPKTKVATYAVSITDAEKVAAVVKEIGTIDILVLNAGMLHKPAPVLDIDPQEAVESFQVNVLGPWSLIREFVKLPPRSPGAQRTIVNTSTALIFAIAMPGSAIYGASKGALTYIMRNVHNEHKGAGIRVFSFHPAVAFTRMADKVLGMKEDQFAWDSPEVPANFAVWLCSPEADFLAGRFVHAQWDVEELMGKRDILENDPEQLVGGLVMNKVIEKAA